MSNQDSMKERVQELVNVTAGWEEKYLQLKAKAALAGQLNDAGIDCMVAMDLEERILYWNPTCTDIYGTDYKASAGKTLSSVFPSIACQPAIVNALSQAKSGLKVFVPSEPDMWLPGHFELHLVPLKDAAGAVTGILFIAHDVAHRAYAEQQLKDLNRKLAARYAELERANATLATFTRITGNQFKEPLRKIYSTLERTVIEEGGRLLPKGRGSIRKVQSSAQRLGLLADSLTTFSEAKQVMVEAVSLNDVLRQVLVVLQPQIRELDAEVSVSALPEVKGDFRQLKTLFQQLLSNALKFQPPGNKPFIAVRTAAVSLHELPGEVAKDAPAYCCICIQDNGIGIAPDARERVFQLFEKAHGEDRYKGTGLGLALARKIAENHEGAIRVGDVPAEGGSIIMCYLPL